MASAAPSQRPFFASMLELEKHLSAMDRILNATTTAVHKPCSDNSTLRRGEGDPSPAQTQAPQRAPPPNEHHRTPLEDKGTKPATLRPVVAHRNPRSTRTVSSVAHPSLTATTTAATAQPSTLSPNVGRVRDAASKHVAATGVASQPVTAGGARTRDDKPSDHSPNVLSFRPRTLPQHVDVATTATLALTPAASHPDTAVTPQRTSPREPRLQSNPVLSRSSESLSRTADASVDGHASELASGPSAAGHAQLPSTALVPSPAPRGPGVTDDSSSRRARRAVYLPDVTIAWGCCATASTASWRSKIHAKGFLSSIVGIPPPSAGAGGMSLSSNPDSCMAREFRREASVGSRSHSAAAVNAPTNPHHLDPTVDESGAALQPPENQQQQLLLLEGAPQETLAASLLRRIHQALDHSKSVGYSRETSYLRATSATDHLASTGNTVPSRSASQISRPANERTSFVSGVRHYAHDSIFERLASVGTQSHPIVTPNRGDAGSSGAQKHAVGSASGTLHHTTFSRSSSLPLADASMNSSFAHPSRPRLPPLSSVAASVVAEPAHAAWVGNLRAPVVASRTGTAAATSASTHVVAKKGGTAAQPSVAAGRVGGAHRPVTVPAAPPDSIWGRLYGIATKKRRDEQERAEKTHATHGAHGGTVTATAVAAARSGHSKHPTQPPAPHTRSAAVSQSHHQPSAGASGAGAGGRSACPEVVLRLLHHDARHKEEIRQKQRLQELAEQEKIQREREEIFKKAARFREAQLKHAAVAHHVPPAVSHGSVHSRSKEPNHAVAGSLVHRSNSAAAVAVDLSHSKRANTTVPVGVATSTKPTVPIVPLSSGVSSVAPKKVDIAAVVAASAMSAAQRYEVDTDDEAGSDFVDIDPLGLEDAVLTPNGTWHRRTPIGRPPVSPVKRPPQSFRHVPGPPLSGNRNAVSPIEIGPDALSRKSQNIDKVPHSRTSSYVSVSSPAVPTVVASRPEVAQPVTPFASRLNEVQDDGREEVLDLRVGAPRLAAASSSNRPAVVSSVASLGYLSSLGRSGGGVVSTVTPPSGPPPSSVVAVDPSPSPAPPLVTPLDFSKLRRPTR